MKKRKEKLKEITNEYSSINPESISETFENIRLTGERFWVDYLSPDVWNKIDVSSRRELGDAFVTEIMLKNGILRGWSQVVLSLCKVIEREITDILFTKWIKEIRKAEFTIPAIESKKNLKRIKSRELTFRMLKSCADSEVHPPTLGQLAYVSKFWSDDIMEQCTSLFSSINAIAEKTCKNHTLKIKKLSQLLEDKHYYNEESPTLIDLRNASAHPGSEKSFTWSEHISWLKQLLGKPPREALKLVIEIKQY